MKKHPTKAELREELNNQVQAFLNKGGSISQCEMGATGLVDGKYNTRNMGFSAPPQERTPVNGVLARIDARRSKSAPVSADRPRRKPRKKIIYDDFGEPLRWVWIDNE
ncbi:hypothetical protein [Marinobacterium jannaschii]|uniref:hypothetical protein n=1 Tax=Marinobacterium jannaschii TaxID=64970 RepID=UPI00048332B9|nr:hypothetical protein [Marinobacterium jannaschii]